MNPIAVPVRTKGRSATPQHSRTAHSSLSIRPVAVSQLPANEANPKHQFRVGQRLKMTSGGSLLERVGSMVTVLHLQPYERNELRYRVRSDLENYERIVVESQLIQVEENL
jgi:hypothetical protein